MFGRRTTVIRFERESIDHLASALSGRADTASSASSPRLELEERSEHFVESVQKLTYFFVTAGVAIIALELKFMTDNLKVAGKVAFKGAEGPLLISSVATGCLTAALAIQSIRLTFRSSALNLGYLYQGRAFADLTCDERKTWTRVNSWARRTSSSALLLLITEVLLGLAFLICFLLR